MNPDVLHQYRQILTSDFSLISAGFFVDKCEYLGASPDGMIKDASGQASPDGMIKDASGQLVKVVEVKCPFRARDKTVQQACIDDKSVCCSIVNNTPCLRIDHKYRVRWP